MQLVHNNVNGDRLKIAKNRKKLILFSSTLTFRWYDGEQYHPCRDQNGRSNDSTWII